MKKLLCIALMLALLSMPAYASPEPDQFHALLVPKLESSGSMQDPFDRWAREFVALIQPEIHYASWPEGQSLLVDVWIGSAYAFSIELLAEGDRVAMQTTLIEGSGWMILSDDSAKDMLALLARCKEALAPDLDWPQADCTLTIHAGRAVEQLNDCAEVADRWAEVADDPNKEWDRAIAVFLRGCADILSDDAPSAPTLSVFVDYQAPNLVPGTIQRGWAEADTAHVARVLSLIPGELAKMIAGLES